MHTEGPGPLIDKKEIERRLDAVEAFNCNAMLREEIREYLNPIYDMERLIGRVTYQTANPRDLTAFTFSPTATMESKV